MVVLLDLTIATIVTAVIRSVGAMMDIEGMLLEGTSRSSTEVPDPTLGLHRRQCHLPSLDIFHRLGILGIPLFSLVSFMVLMNR